MAHSALDVFAQNLRRLRQQAGLTQEELGAQARIQMADISRYEGGVRDPRLTTLARLATALNVPLADLLRCDDG